MKYKAGAFDAPADEINSPTLKKSVKKQVAVNADSQQTLVRNNDCANIVACVATLRKQVRASLRKVGPYDSRRVSAALHPWLEAVEQDVLPFDPKGALKLVELLMHAPEIDHLDDSYGYIGDLLDHASLLWLRCLPATGFDAEEIMLRLRGLYDGPRSCYFEWTLSRANLVLDEGALRELARRYENDFRGLKSSEASEGGRNRYHLTSAISLLATALRDPDVNARATLLLSPKPNGLQRESLVKAYIKFDRAGDALPWLAEVPSWEHFEPKRIELLDQVYTLLGDVKRANAFRMQLFRLNPSGPALLHWRECLNINEQAEAAAEALECCINTSDPYAGISIAFALNDVQAAEAVAIRLANKMHVLFYQTLQSFADEFESVGSVAGVTACYRVLLEGILDKANSTAYVHAARYWRKLQSLRNVENLPCELEDAQTYLHRMSVKHARKPSFWKRLEHAK